MQPLGSIESYLTKISSTKAISHAVVGSSNFTHEAAASYFALLEPLHYKLTIFALGKDFFASFIDNSA